MSSIHSDSNINLYLNLAPPGSEGDAYKSLATNIHGVPIGQEPGAKDPGQAVANLLGYSNKDTLGEALDDIMALVKQLNSAFIAAEQGTSLDAVQKHLDNADPTSPELPPMKAFIDLSQKMLASGHLGGVKLSAAHEEAKMHTRSDIHQAVNETKQSQEDKVQDGFEAYNEEKNKQNLRSNSMAAPVEKNNDPSAPTQKENPSANSDKNDQGVFSNPYSIAGDHKDAQLSQQRTTYNIIQNHVSDAQNSLKTTSAGNVSFEKTSGGNPWLAGNVYVAFLESFMQMQRMMMQNQSIEGQIQLTSMQQTVTLAKDTAQVIMDVAKQNQFMHIASAVMAGVSIAVTVGSMGIAAGGPGAADGEAFSEANIQRATAVSGLGSAISQLGTSISQAATDTSIAAGQGQEEILRAYGQIVSQQMSKAGDAVKADVDAISQLFQTLDQIRQSLQQAVQASLSAR